MNFRQWRATINGETFVTNEHGKFVPIPAGTCAETGAGGGNGNDLPTATLEHVTEHMTPSPETTGWAEDQKHDRAAADQEGDK